jgi:hypothetical protein
MTNQADKDTDKEISRAQDIVEELEEELEAETQLEDFAEPAPEMSAVKSPFGEGIIDRNTGLGRTLHHLQDVSAHALSPTGGDIDADQYLAQVVGEEAIGGTTPTPDQNVVENLAVSAGIEIPDKATLHTSEMLERRNSHRWELDPESAEDYQEHER